MKGDAWRLGLGRGRGGGGRCAGWRAPPSPRIKGPIQTLFMGADSEVCAHGWIDGFWAV